MKIKVQEEMPMLGASYYPEDWDESEQTHDIALMKKAGLKMVRIAEFAWYKMEPKEGEYDFAWLHRVIGRLGDAGIHVVLGTPTATPPIWLEEKDPDMFRVDENGLRELHGGRRHCCSNNETYREYSVRITKRMAEEFGQDERVVGWQMDNEIYTVGKGCFCETCRKRFHEYLTAKYRTIENLNERWNLNIFSQWYDSFDQIPMPARSWQNPHLRLEWAEFQGESHIGFIRLQADILHNHVKAPIGTDMMPKFGVDHVKIAEVTDVMQFNHYNDEGNLYATLFWYDYLRTLKDRPFWNMETSTCWGAGTATPPNLRPEGFCRINSWLPILLGGEANMYWLWRQHWGGHELMHGSVLYASGRPMYTFGEVQETANEYEKAGALLSGTKVVTDVAFMVSAHNSLLMEHQKVVEERGDAAFLYIGRITAIHRMITEYGLRPDVIEPGKNLNGYKLLIMPYMMTLEMDELQDRICDWVRAGGTWVVGPMTDIRDEVGAHYKDRETGVLEAFTGATIVDQIPDAEHRVECSWADGSPFLANSWLQLMDVPDDVERLVTVTGDYHSAIKGRTVVFRKRIGKGTVIVLGARPSVGDMHRLLSVAVSASQAQHFDISGSVMAAKRRGASGEILVLAEYGNRKGTARLDCRYYDVLGEEEHDGEISLRPYQVMVLLSCDKLGADKTIEQ